MVRIITLHMTQTRILGHSRSHKSHLLLRMLPSPFQANVVVASASKRRPLKMQKNYHQSLQSLKTPRFCSSLQQYFSTKNKTNDKVKMPLFFGRFAVNGEGPLWKSCTRWLQWPWNLCLCCFLLIFFIGTQKNVFLLLMEWRKENQQPFKDKKFSRFRFFLEYYKKKRVEN